MVCLAQGECAVNNIILFDGECNFCNFAVQFIIKRDKKALFRFASIESNAGKEILKAFNVSKNIDSVILVENNKCYYKSSAVFRICKKLNGAWKLLYCLILLPRLLRDYFYSIIAANRYKWFGKKDHCMIPSPEIRKRFL
jgi:predicted DCC family thiol-disulfide oxidoreductase YuxK